MPQEPAQSPQAGPATPPAATPPATPPEPQAPPWGSAEEFNPEKAWNLIQALRADKDKLAARPALTDEQQKQIDEYQRLVEASKTDAQRKDEELARWQTDAEQWRARAVAARVHAIAAADFADPTDAVGAVDPAKYLTAGGEIDEAAIQADLAQVLERKPHWRRSPDGSPAPRVPAPNPAQGSGGGAPVAGDPAAAFAAILQSQMRSGV
jgi:hypothetical protein